MSGYFNKSAATAGAVLGATSNVAAANMTDTILELVPVIVELAIVIAMLTLVLRMVKKLG
jgi:hypothetical protein